jgi:hypothetical protein
VDADVGADTGEDAAEAVGPMPGDHEGADAAAAVAGDGGLIGVGAQLDAVLFLDGRKELVEEELGVRGGDAVVFVAAVETREGLATGCWHHAGLDEDANEGWNVLFGDEIVEDDGSLVDDAVLKDHEGGGLGFVEAGGKVDLVFASGAGKDAALLRDVGVFEHGAFRHVWLRLGVFGEGKLWLGGEGRMGKKKKECEGGTHGRMLAEARTGRQRDLSRARMSKTPMPGRLSSGLFHRRLGLAWGSLFHPLHSSI